MNSCNFLPINPEPPIDCMDRLQFLLFELQSLTSVILSPVSTSPNIDLLLWCLNHWPLLQPSVDAIQLERLTAITPITFDSVVASSSAYWTSFGTHDHPSGLSDVHNLPITITTDALSSSTTDLTPDPPSLQSSVRCLTLSTCPSSAKNSIRSTTSSFFLACARCNTRFLPTRGSFQHLCPECWKDFSSDHLPVIPPDGRTMSFHAKSRTVVYTTPSNHTLPKGPKSRSQSGSSSTISISLVCARCNSRFQGWRGQHLCHSCWKDFSSDHLPISLPDGRTMSMHGWTVQILAFSYSTKSSPIRHTPAQLSAIARSVVEDVIREHLPPGCPSRPLSPATVQDTLSRTEIALNARIPPQQYEVSMPTARFPPITPAHSRDRLDLWDLRGEMADKDFKLRYLERQLLAIRRPPVPSTVPSSSGPSFSIPFFSFAKTPSSTDKSEASPPPDSGIPDETSTNPPSSSSITDEHSSSSHEPVPKRQRTTVPDTHGDFLGIPIRVITDNCAQISIFSDARLFHDDTVPIPAGQIIGLGNSASDISILGMNSAVLIVRDRNTQTPLVLHIGGSLQADPNTLSRNVISGPQVSTVFVQTCGTLGAQFLTPNYQLCYMQLPNGHEVALDLQDGAYGFLTYPIPPWAYTEYIHLHLFPDVITTDHFFPQPPLSAPIPPSSSTQWDDPRSSSFLHSLRTTSHPISSPYHSFWNDHNRLKLTNRTPPSSVIAHFRTSTDNAPCLKVWFLVQTDTDPPTTSHRRGPFVISIDTGSNDTYISHEIAEGLGLFERPEYLTSSPSTAANLRFRASVMDHTTRTIAETHLCVNFSDSGRLTLGRHLAAAFHLSISWAPAPRRELTSHHCSLWPGDPEHSSVIQALAAGRPLLASQPSLPDIPLGVSPSVPPSPSRFLTITPRPSDSDIRNEVLLSFAMPANESAEHKFLRLHRVSELVQSRRLEYNAAYGLPPDFRTPVDRPAHVAVPLIPIRTLPVPAPAPALPSGSSSVDISSAVTTSTTANTFPGFPSSLSSSSSSTPSYSNPVVTDLGDPSSSSSSSTPSCSNPVVTDLGDPLSSSSTPHGILPPAPTPLPIPPPGLFLAIGVLSRDNGLSFDTVEHRVPTSMSIFDFITQHYGNILSPIRVVIHGQERSHDALFSSFSLTDRPFSPPGALDHEVRGDEIGCLRLHMYVPPVHPDESHDGDSHDMAESQARYNRTVQRIQQADKDDASSPSPPKTPKDPDSEQEESDDDFELFPPTVQGRPPSFSSSSVWPSSPTLRLQCRPHI